MVVVVVPSTMNDDSNRRGKTGRSHRRKFLKGVGASAVIATAGCLGGSGGSGGNIDIGDPPWSTEDLRDAAEEEGGTFTSYWGGDPPELINALVSKIGDTYDAPWFETEPISGDSANTGQRLAQELEQGEVVPSLAQGLPAVSLNQELREEHLVSGIGDLFESYEPFRDTALVQEYQVRNSDVGVKYAPVYHEEEFANSGYPLDPLLENQYNAIVDGDTYDGLTVMHNIETAWEYAGSHLTHYPPGVDMEAQPWARELLSTVNPKFNTSHSDGVRQLIGGEATMQLMGYPDHVLRFPEEPLAAVWPDKFEIPVGRNGMFLLQDADDPWAARFFAAAVMEPEIQKWMATSDDFGKPPARVDLDYSDASEFTQKLLGAETELIISGPERFEEFVDMSQNILRPIYEEMQ